MFSKVNNLYEFTNIFIYCLFNEVKEIGRVYISSFQFVWIRLSSFQKQCLDDARRQDLAHLVLQNTAEK